jgi:tetratricopeptide (TPR) repeat protein
MVLSGQGEARSGADRSDRISDLGESLSSTQEGPAAAALLVSRAELWRLGGNWQASLRDLDAAAGLVPNQAELGLQRGLTFREAGRDHEAVLCFQAYLSAHPEDGFAWLQIGRTLSGLQIYLDARHAYTRAIRLSRNPSPEIYLEHADAIQAQGADHDAEALLVIESGIATLGSAVSLELRALELEQRLDRFDAAPYRVSVLAYGARSKAPWLLRRGEILLRAQRRDEARKTMLEARRLAIDVPALRRQTTSNSKMLKSIDDLLIALRN